MPNVDKTELRNRLADPRLSGGQYALPVPFKVPGTALALPFATLTLDGLTCVHPECVTCCRERSSYVPLDDYVWPEAVSWSDVQDEQAELHVEEHRACERLDGAVPRVVCRYCGEQWGYDIEGGEW